ncbi:hypothetical protein N9L19_01090 [bacterium]|nr:hypothetical protein [bacterium]
MGRFGRADFLSTKVMDGWKCQENNAKNNPVSFEGYAREMKLLLKTYYVGHVIDMLQMMVQFEKKCVPDGYTVMLRKMTVKAKTIPPTYLNPATIAEDVARIQERTESRAGGRTAFGQGSG